jgi:hypothetical protein
LLVASLARDDNEKQRRSLRRAVRRFTPLVLHRKDPPLKTKGGSTRKGKRAGESSRATEIDQNSLGFGDTTKRDPSLRSG